MLIGRAAAQRRIDELWESARTGSSETLVLVGEPEIRKTALLETNRDHPEDDQVASRSRAPNTGSAAQV